MKKTIFALFAIVALASCGNKTTETNSDSTVVADSTMSDSLTLDSTVSVLDTTAVETK
jgi:uncharacterized protein YcfL